jgi:proteasome alpha subunit
MTEEPYRWLEAVANRREYVREQLKGGTPVLGASLPEGILLLGVGGGQSKVFELFDRHALAGLGHPADIERIRQAAIDAAHVEAFTRAPEDVSLRRLVGFGLGPQLKTNFEQIFSAPFLVELLLAELGPEPGRDLFFRLHFDGSYQTQFGGAVVAAIDAEAEAGARKWLGEMIQTNKPFTERLPEEEARRAGWREAAKGKEIEIGWLARRSSRPARYQAPTAAELGL